MTGLAKEFRLLIDPLPLTGEAPVRSAGVDLPMLSVEISEWPTERKTLVYRGETHRVQQRR